MALFQHKLAGGDAASAPVVAPVAASAATLGAFKNNLNSITQSLASTIAFPRAGARPAAALGPQAQQEVRMGAHEEPYIKAFKPYLSAIFVSHTLFVTKITQALLARVSGAVPGHTRTGSSGVSVAEAAINIKERTREGFSKMVKGLQGMN